MPGALSRTTLTAEGGFVRQVRIRVDRFAQMAEDESSRSGESEDEQRRQWRTAGLIRGVMAVRETVRKPESGSTPAAAYPGFRSCVERRGKFLFAGESKLYVRGVAYGTFRPNEEGVLFPARGTVERDFAAMAAHGINTIRTYTVPPRWLLDSAHRRP